MQLLEDSEKQLDSKRDQGFSLSVLRGTVI